VRWVPELVHVSVSDEEEHMVTVANGVIGCNQAIFVSIRITIVINAVANIA
jgi:hypothetical protein